MKGRAQLPLPVQKNKQIEERNVVTYSDYKTALVTGASTGMGAAIAKQVP